MKPLDDELKSAFRCVEPPPGFAGRVLVRLKRKPGRKAGWGENLRSLLARPRLRWAAAIAFGCLLAVFGLARYHRYEQERIQGDMAKAQLKLAIEIASAKLNVALERVGRMNRRQGEPGTRAKSPRRLEHL